MLEAIPHLDFSFVLQTDWWADWKNGNWFDAVFAPILWRFGRPAAALLIAAPFSMALWQQAESAVPPAIMIVLFMGLILGGAPAGAAFAGYLLVVVAVTIAYRSIFSGGEPA